MITIDSISHLNHSIAIIDSAGDALAIAADGSIAVTDNGGSLTVDGTVELGAASLAALESITVQNPGGASAVNIQDGGNSITVDGSVSITGTVAVTQSTSPWVIGDGGGSITVDGTLAGFYAEDSAHVSADIGVQILSVRRDANTSLVSADGDYAPLQVNSLGALKVGLFDGAGDQLAINADGSLNAQFTESGYSSWQVSNFTANTTEGSITSFANRLRVEIQNLGSQDLYIRHVTGVTSANGLKIPKGSSYEQALDNGAAIFYVTGAGSTDVRVAEYAA
jgi:hypothetical protein